MMAASRFPHRRNRAGGVRRVNGAQHLYLNVEAALRAQRSPVKVDHPKSLDADRMFLAAVTANHLNTQVEQQLA